MAIGKLHLGAFDMFSTNGIHMLYTMLYCTEDPYIHSVYSLFSRLKFFQFKRAFKYVVD